MNERKSMKKMQKRGKREKLKEKQGEKRREIDLNLKGHYLKIYIIVFTRIH